MSTSHLYHVFGLVGYEYIRTRYTGGAVIFSVKRKREKIRCPVCRSRDIIFRGKFSRRFRIVPVGLQRVFLDYEVQRLACRRCGNIRQEKLGFADPRLSYSHAFERYALDLSKHMTIQDVARHLGVSWDVIKGIQKKDLTRRFSRQCLKDVRRIAIDEISVLKGHRYLTVVLDMDTGAVIFVGYGKGSDALDPFWKKLKRSRTKVRLSPWICRRHTSAPFLSIFPRQPLCLTIFMLPSSSMTNCPISEEIYTGKQRRISIRKS
jgi:transposase